MKTPEEIKKALMFCQNGSCKFCPYDDDEACGRSKNGDALAYIEQLESTYSQVSKALCGKENATLAEVLQAVDQVKNDLQYTTDAANIMKDEALKLESRLAQVERERDAALQTVHGLCLHCKNDCSEKCRKCLFWPSRVYFVSTETYVDYWEWLGVCDENTKGDAGE